MSSLYVCNTIFTSFLLNQFSVILICITCMFKNLGMYERDGVLTTACR